MTILPPGGSSRVSLMWRCRREWVWHQLCVLSPVVLCVCVNQREFLLLSVCVCCCCVFFFAVIVVFSLSLSLFCPFLTFSPLKGVCVSFLTRPYSSSFFRHILSGLLLLSLSLLFSLNKNNKKKPGGGEQKTTTATAKRRRRRNKQKKNTVHDQTISRVFSLSRRSVHMHTQKKALVSLKDGDRLLREPVFRRFKNKMEKE